MKVMCKNWIRATVVCLLCKNACAAAKDPIDVGGGDMNVIVAESLCENSPTDIEVAECAVVYRIADGARIAAASVGSVTPDFAFEPGSIIAPVAVATGIECGVATLDTLYDTEREDPRYVLLPGDGAHVWPEKLSVADALVHSSNVVIGKLGYDVGPKDLLSSFAAFGIGSNGGTLPRFDRTDKATWSRLAIGQGFTATLDEMARAYVILANHGLSPWTKEQIVPAKTADAVAEVLRRVPTNEGTARRAAVEGMAVAGKTGTAQVADGNHYVRRYHGSFIGFFPAEAPSYVVAVLARSNIGQRYHQGGHYPALAFSQIVRGMLAAQTAGTPSESAKSIAIERIRVGESSPASQYMTNSPCASFVAEYDNPVCTHGFASAENVREINRIRKFVGELFSEAGRIAGTGWGTCSNRITTVRDGVMRVRGNYFGMYDDAMKEAKPESDRMSCSWEVRLDGRMVWDDERFVSYRIRCQTYFGGVHPDVQFINGVYDRKLQRRLLPEDVIKGDSLLAVLNLLRKGIAKNNGESAILSELSQPETRSYAELRKIRYANEKDSSDWSNIPFLTKNFFLDGDGLTWTFDEYELSSYGDGCPEGTVSWDDLALHIKEKSIMPKPLAPRAEFWERLRNADKMEAGNLIFF